MLMCELDVMEYAVTMEEVEVDEDFFDYEPDVDECGFNPYMGCYDFDCQSRSFYYADLSRTYVRLARSMTRARLLKI